MQITALFTVAALAGSAIAAGAEAPIAARDCVNGGFFYGEQGCKPNCQGGKCVIQPGHENDKDYICVCDDTSKPGCGGMFKGKPACSSKCKSGNCTQLLLPYTCEC